MRGVTMLKRTETCAAYSGRGLYGRKFVSDELGASLREECGLGLDH